MPQWENTHEVFTRMLDSMRTVEDCMRRLAVLREDPRYIKLATIQGNMRDKAVEIAHRIADEKLSANLN